jgi:hypothetical protein
MGLGLDGDRTGDGLAEQRRIIQEAMVCAGKDFDLMKPIFAKFKVTRGIYEIKKNSS